LEHPNIIKYKGSQVAVEDYTLAIALEYAEFGCLQRVVDDHGPLDSPYLETYLVDALRGLRYVHSKGIIHRDIKPSNLLLCKSVHRPICKLTDFGAAIPFDMLQSSNSCIGTPAFMAPEQMEGDTGYYSDVWAIGVTALFLSTGSLPYEFSAGMTSAQLMFAIVVDGARPIIRAGVTPRLRGLVELCIYEKAEDRPSVAQILDLLEQDLDFLEAE
jgi:serine/threonine protein kinase